MKDAKKRVNKSYHYKNIHKGRGKKKVSKRLLRKFIKQNKATKWIALYFRVSERTVYRRIREYGLKGIRPHGKKPIIKKPPIIKIPRGWLPIKKYIDLLNESYGFQNIQYPPTKYVDTETRICSNAQHNPKGKFTTCTVYYVALESELFFLYTIQYRYSNVGVSLDEIYHYFSNNAYEMLSLSLETTGIEVIDIVAFHFISKSGSQKPYKQYSNERFFNEME